MNVTLIPFFLAANLAVNDVDNFTPEFLFTGEIEVDFIDSNNTRNYHGKITFPLKCRTLTDIDSLSCRILHVSLRISDKETEVQPSLPEGLDMPFNIKFNEKGVQTVTISIIARMLWLCAIKEIAEALSIGIDLNKVDQLPKVLTGTEKTLMGQVDTTFNIYTIPSANLPFTAQNRNDNLNLHAIHLPEIDRDTCIVIEKSRDVANSDDINEALESINKADVNVAIESCNATMYIGDGGIFRCEINTALKGVVARENKKRVTTVRKSLRLTLESVDNATEEWPVPEETETSELYVENFLQSDYVIML